MSSSDENGTKNVDVFKDTSIRYLGYANEVGEAFRSLVNVNWVRFSYAVACAYVCADASHKGHQAKKLSWPNDTIQRNKVMQAVADTLIWQGLASVAIPGFTINRICWLSGKLLRNVSSIPGPAQKWTVTAIGLASIPVIIKPIDNSVDRLLESTLRKWYGIGQELEDQIVHHRRND